MKKFILAFAVLCISAGFSFAIEPDPGYKILEEFNREFPNAEKVTWSEESQYAKASFVLAGKRTIAYFSQEGNLEGAVRDIFYDQLPLTVMTAIERRFKYPEVLYIREISNVEGTHYKIRLDADQKKLMVRVGADGNISEVGRVK